MTHKRLEREGGRECERYFFFRFDYEVASAVVAENAELFFFYIRFIRNVYCLLSCFGLFGDYFIFRFDACCNGLDGEGVSFCMS